MIHRLPAVFLSPLTIPVSAALQLGSRIQNRTARQVVTLVIAAFTDPAMALAFLKALPGQEQYRQELEALENRSNRLAQRQKEAEAHESNKRLGKPGVKKH